jgi:tyrosyl-tRNA synthetase
MTVDEQLAALCRDAVDLVSEDELRAKLARGKPLVVKYGADPSAPDLHLGHSVVLRKLRQFQDLGHQVVFIIGDFTGMIGDPSGRSKTRPSLSEEEIQRNARTYAEQVGKIIDLSRARMVRNGEWLNPMRFADVVRLAAKYTVARMLERDDFRKRLEAGEPLGVHELLYPLAQAYDSVFIRADVELGGTDQLFNFLVARDIQRAHGQEPQVVLTTPLLEGLDGTEKMSKSLGNYVGLTDPPDEMYGKLMSIPDQLMTKYLRLVTDVPRGEVEQMERGLGEGAVHPKTVKMRLAREIVTMYHSLEAAEAAEARFDRVFSQRDLPDDMPEVRLPADDLRDGRIWVVRLLSLCGFAPSNSEARRLVAQGAVRINGRRVDDPEAAVLVEDGATLQVGKRRFARIRR